MVTCFCIQLWMKKRAFSLNPEGSPLSFAVLLFTVEATLNKQVNYPHWTLPVRMLSSTACCCCFRGCAVISRYLPKKQQVISPGSYTFNILPDDCKIEEEREYELPVAKSVFRLRIHQVLCFTLGSQVISPL